MALFGKKYSCPTCGMKFRSESELRQHQQVHMSAAQPATSVTCPICGASFRSQAEFAEHKRKSHSM